MADESYPLGGQGVYFKQGNKELVVGSTATLTIESGATVTDAGTASFTGVKTVASGGVLSVADGGELAVPVTTKSTSTGTITNYGVTTFGSTSADTYTLTAPDRAGLRKTLICTVHGATTISSAITTATTNSYIRGSTVVAADTHTLTFLKSGQFMELISVSTSEWRLLSATGADLLLS